MDFLHRRDFHAWNKKDAGPIECARKGVCVTACIVVCHGCDTDSPCNQSGRDLAGHHGDIGTGRQARMKMQVGGNLLHGLPQSERVQFPGD